MADNELDYWEHLSCILEVDLEYPEQLHNLHNDYPLLQNALKLKWREINYKSEQQDPLRCAL